MEVPDFMLIMIYFIYRGFQGLGMNTSPAKTARMQEREQRFGTVTKQTKRQEPLALQINQIQVWNNCCKEFQIHSRKWATSVWKKKAMEFGEEKKSDIVHATFSCIRLSCILAINYNIHNCTTFLSCDVCVCYREG